MILNREHENIIQNPQGCDITQIQRKEFPIWFKKRVSIIEFKVIKHL